MAKRKKATKHFVERELHGDEKDCPFTFGPREKVASRYSKTGLTFVRSQHLEDVLFEDCKFVGASLVTFGSAEHRSTVRRAGMKRCTVNSFSAVGAVLEDVVIEGLRVSVHPVRIDGCALTRCVIAGDCGRFLLSPNVRSGSSPEDAARNASFAAANAEFYKSVDWALDISQAKVACFEIRGAIPPHLILRNPDEQFLMTREVALSGKWKKQKPPSATTIGIDMFTEAGGDVELFVCARRSTGFKEEVEFFQRLKAKWLVT
jgi:hypothetical protein